MSGGGEASCSAEGDRLTCGQQRARWYSGPRIDFLPAGGAHNELELRDVSHRTSAVNNLSLDHEDRYTLVLFHSRGDTIEGKAAEVHREAYQLVKRTSLRQGAYDFGPPSNENAIDNEQHQNRGLQT